MCMMHKIKNVKNKIISFSSKDLFLSIDYSKKVNLDKLIDLNSNYNFVDKKSNDLLKIKIENEIIPDRFLKIEKVSDKDCFLYISIYHQKF